MAVMSAETLYGFLADLVLLIEIGLIRFLLCTFSCPAVMVFTLRCYFRQNKNRITFQFVVFAVMNGYC